MAHNDLDSFAAGYIHSLSCPGCDVHAVYARFHRQRSDGSWIRGSGIEKRFDDELAAFHWLRSLGCADDRVIVFRRGSAEKEV